MSYLDQALEQAQALGGPVAEAYRPVLAWREQAGVLNAQLESARAAGERDHAALVREVAEGLGLAQVPARAVNPWEYDSPASKAVVAAVATCHAQVDAAARDTAPQVFAALQTLVDGVVGESVKLVAGLPGNVVDNETAFRHGPTHFGSWMRCGELVDVWLQAHALAEVLRLAGWVAGPEHRHKSALRPMGFTRFRHPSRLPAGWSAQPEPLKLGMAAASGAEPGLYDWAEAQARQAARDAREGRTDMHVMSTETVFSSAWEAGAHMAVAANTPVPAPSLAG